MRPEPRPAADVVFINGRVATGDPARPTAQALAVRNGRIAAVGDSEEIKALAGAGTQTIDLAGRTALPGFTDSHVHYYDWAISRSQLPLDGTRSLNDMLDLVARAAGDAPEGRWLCGRGWDQDRWPGAPLPHRAMLDKISPDNPVLLYRRDMHLAVANSAALAAAGVDENTPDPPGGSLDHDPDGRPGGVLRDLAMNLVSDVVPMPGGAELVDLMADAQTELHRYGVTGLCDLRVMGGPDGQPAFTGWQRLHAAGRLALRAWVCLPGEYLDQAIGLGLASGLGDDWLRIGHMKYFVDGSMGARTAWVDEPYLDGGHGLELADMDRLTKAISRADRAGLAVTVHAIGDRANRELITAFTNALDGPGRNRPVAHRIEHVQIIRPEDIRRLGRLGVSASVQPLHAPYDIRAHETGIGELSANAYPFRSLAGAGVDMVFGSDCPVTEPRPLWGIHAALTRCQRNGEPKGGWYADQCLNLDQALAAYTTVPARVTGRASSLGSLTPGKLADVVVLDHDPAEVEPDEIHSIGVDLTMVHGRVVWRRV